MRTLRTIEATPMAPYIGVMKGMTREEKQIVVTFLTESMQSSPSSRKGWDAAAKKAHEEGQDELMVDDVFTDETLEDWKW